MDVQSTSRLLLGLIAAALVATSAIGMLLLRASEETRSLVIATRDARLAHEALLDQQVGIRGFLLSGETRYLEPHDAGRAAISGLHRSVATHVGGDPELILLLVDAELAADRWMEQSKPVGVDHALLTGAAMQAFIDEGKVLFDRYRVAHQALVDRVAAERDAVVAREHRLVVGGFALQLLVLGATAWCALRQRWRLARGVVSPLRDLQSVIERLRIGDLEARLQAAHYCEISSAGLGLGELAAELGNERERARVRSEALSERADRLRELLHTSREISSTPDVRVIREVVERTARDLSGCSSSRVYLTGQDPGLLASDLEEVRSTGTPLLRSGRVAVPMVVGGRVLGVLECVTAPRANAGADPDSTSLEVAGEDVVELLSLLANQAAAALDAAALQAVLAEESTLDALTALRNRRTLEGHLARTVEEVRRTGQAVSLVALDVDHFKAVNDGYGHPVGDLVLCHVAEAIRRCLRTGDEAFRLGGEEFLVVLPGMAVDVAIDVAERIRAAVAADPPLGIGLTISAGAAALGPGESPAELLARADAALYRAKGEGRDRALADSGPRPLRTSA